MKITLRAIALLGLAAFAYFYWGEEALSHLMFPTVPADIALSPTTKNEELDMQQFLAMLAGVILLSFGLFLIFKNKFLPTISQALIDWLTGQNTTYSPEDDELVQILEQIGDSHQQEDLLPLDELCKRKPKRLRHWMEYANLLKTRFRDYEAAIAILNRAYNGVEEAEDKALILYRIAGIYEQELNQQDKAQDYYLQAAARFPHCAYGKLAGKK